MSIMPAAPVLWLFQYLLFFVCAHHLTSCSGPSLAAWELWTCICNFHSQFHVLGGPWQKTQDRACRNGWSGSDHSHLPELDLAQWTGHRLWAEPPLLDWCQTQSHREQQLWWQRQKGCLTGLCIRACMCAGMRVCVWVQVSVCECASVCVSVLESLCVSQLTNVSGSKVTASVYIYVSISACACVWVH